MAFLRYANAVVSSPSIGTRRWSRIRTAAVGNNLGISDQAEEILGEKLDLSRFLLTHVTIVASVNTETPPGTETGMVKFEGQQIKRSYPDYRITKETENLINGNMDAFERKTLLKSFKTFIGGHNFCFAPGTKVMLADGSYRAIEDIQVGNQVITHTGVTKSVLHIFERDYTGDIQSIQVEGFKNPILATGNHPFRTIPAQADIHEGGCSTLSVGKAWTPASSLQADSYLLGSEDPHGGCSVHRVASNVAVPYTGKVYNLEVADEHSYVVDPGIAVHNCEHLQLLEESKGRIIDAVARDVDGNVYIDILVATDRAHEKLVRDIEAGDTTTLSMGCSIDFSVCTKCGNVAVDETEFCAHIKFQKGSTFTDESGVQRLIAELCGHHSVDPTGGVRFIEASWVGVPAFKGAVLRNVLTPRQKALVSRKAEKILSSVPPRWDESALKKVATLKVSGEDPDLSFLDDAPADDAAKPAAPDKADAMDSLVDEVEKYVSDKVRKRLQDKLNPKKDEAPVKSPIDNNNLAKDGGYIGTESFNSAVKALSRTASTSTSYLKGVQIYLQGLQIHIGSHLYAAALLNGSPGRYKNAQQYLDKCGQHLGYRPDQQESETLLRLASLLGIWEGSSKTPSKK